jgi:hypothetical protein
MTKLMDQMLQLIQHDADRKLAEFAGQFVRAAPEEKETILAGIDFERWLAETCEECLQKPSIC